MFMTNFGRTSRILTVTALTAGILVSGVADAKRLGGGRSSGRSYSSSSSGSSYNSPNRSSYSSNPGSSYASGSGSNSRSGDYRPAYAGNSGQYTTTRNGTTTTYSAQRPGVSTGTLAGAALAAGAAGYMLGHSGNADASQASRESNAANTQATYDNPYGSNNSGTSSSSQKSSSGSSFLGSLLNILFLAMLVLGGLYLFNRFRKKKDDSSKPAYAGGNYSSRSPDSSLNSTSGDNSARRNLFGELLGGSSRPAAMGAAATGSMPDAGADAEFLRTAKGLFNHLQALNQPQQLGEIRNYLTHELYDELKQDISSNNQLPEFEQVKATLADTRQYDQWLVRQVVFDGLVSEQVGEPFTPFAENWEFVRPANDASQPWKLSRIEVLN